MSDFDQRRRTTRREPLTVKNIEYVGQLIPGSQSTELYGIDIAQQTMQYRSPGFDVVALDIDKAPVAGRHQHGNATGARRLPQQYFDVQRVGLLDDHIKAVQELFDRLRRKPSRKTSTAR